MEQIYFSAHRCQSKYSVGIFNKRGVLGNLRVYQMAISQITVTNYENCPGIEKILE